jgi:hypothetical protein
MKQPKRLNQLLAIQKTRTADAEDEFTQIYHLLKRQGAFEGFSKRFDSSVEGLTLPSEKTNVVAAVPNLMKQVRATLTNLFDLVATRDSTNGVARANVVVNGQTILENVPSTTLIFLDKQMTDLWTVLSKMPTLDAALTWTWDADNGVYRSDEQWTFRQEKHREFPVVYPATDKHPAQVKEVDVTVNVGKWYTTKFSGAISATDKARVLERIDVLRVAVKEALEEANLVSTVEYEMGDKVFDYIFGAVVPGMSPR